MSLSVEVPPVIGQKRGPGRPPKSGAALNKKQKRSSTIVEELNTPHETPPPDRKSRGLPTRIHDTKPLPTLRQPQALTLPDNEYASIAHSGVLAKSLDQSRVSWTQTGVFERYWTKPETGKNARPSPPNNPDLKSMKSRGKCRLRIEPHIFEVEIYVVEKPRPQPPKQYLPPRPQGVAQPWQGQAYQGQSPHNTQAQTSQQAPADPVIGLLAARAGSDPELKALMREVAKGNAPPELLRTFQRHIDELNAELRTQKNWEQEQERNIAAQSSAAATSVETKPFIQHPYLLQQQQKSGQPSQSALPAEVVFAFTTPGATSDRFLFPQHCILESLTPQHLLTSFIVTRQGETATNTNDIDVAKKYWSPVTIMVEVAYGRENILKDVCRWVKSPKESRDHMEQVMATYERMPATHLALRLPLKGTAGAESSNTSKVSTPVPQLIEDKKRRQSKDATVAGRKRSSLAKEKPTAPSATAAAVPGTDADDGQTSSTVKVEPTGSKDDSKVAEAAATSQRPTRATRKSVRISDV
ncbi:hypothetical protein AMS68_002809 [Peltaster fructicola]|uniref:SWR1-complex protein 3 domain-containing protein n=1 Tax=Peltaster fructicola TaxID=286661 RepID=A0A6H0XR89_9PEZI|nr:hypothetical protein AMS68_002809 [Peltaster fructicola]